MASDGLPRMRTPMGIHDEATLYSHGLVLHLCTNYATKIRKTRKINHPKSIEENATDTAKANEKSMQIPPWIL